MDAILGHVADHEIPDGHVVDVLVVRPERGLRVVTRRPAAAVQDRAVLADERIPGLRRDRAPQRMDAGSQTERGVAAIAVHDVLNAHAGPDVDGARRTRDRRLRTNRRRGGWRGRWCRRSGPGVTLFYRTHRGIPEDAIGARRAARQAFVEVRSVRTIAHLLGAGKCAEPTFRRAEGPVICWWWCRRWCVAAVMALLGRASDRIPEDAIGARRAARQAFVEVRPVRTIAHLLGAGKSAEPAFRRAEGPAIAGGGGGGASPPMVTCTVTTAAEFSVLTVKDAECVPAGKFDAKLTVTLSCCTPLVGETN